MPNDDIHNLSHEHAEPHLPQEIVIELLHRQVRNNISPMSLEVDCQQLKQWAVENGNERFRHQNLIRELKTWSHFLSHRPFNRVSINEPFLLVDAPNFTEVVHSIGKNLKLLNAHNIEHAITLSTQYVTKDNIALIKGLKFNHMRIRVDESVSIDSLSKLAEMVREFNIPCVSVVMDIQSNTDDVPMLIMEVLSFIRPETLCFNERYNPE